MDALIVNATRYPPGPNWRPLLGSVGREDFFRTGEKNTERGRKGKGRSLLGVDFENVAVARVLGMSDLEMLLWLEFGAHRTWHMLIKLMLNNIYKYNPSFAIAL